MEYSEKYLKDFFKGLEFNEAEHVYHYNGVKVSKSVSGKLKTFYDEFDAPMIAGFVAKKQGTTREAILEEWAAKGKIATDRGSSIHLFAELYQYDKTLPPSCPEEQAIKRFFDNTPKTIKYITAELRMVDKINLFAGTLDCLAYCTVTDTYYIIDWKTNKDLYKNYKGKKMTGKFSHLLDNSFNKYQLQLSYYQNMIEQIPGIKVSRRIIVWVKPDGTYDMLNCENYTKELKEQLW